MNATTTIVIGALAGLLGLSLLALGLVLRERRRLRATLAQLSDELKTQLFAHRSQRERDEARWQSSSAQAQEAIASSEQKSRFLAAASHDLRQPIHAITLFVAALASENLEGRTRYLVDRLHRSLAGLDELFNRLLDISRLDTGSIDPRITSFPLNPLLQNLDARFAQLASNKNIEFRVRLGRNAQISSDPALLIEIVMNLLSNAFRYTERGGVLLATRRRGASVVIQVWDTGSGIAPENLERIFGEFVQLENPSRDRRKGLGLGLAIVRRIASALGHPLRVRSRRGRGSVFEIEVPDSKEPINAASTAESGAAKSDISGLLVLVVDDEIEVLLATEALLSAWGCFALLARTIAEAQARLAACERFPDVLLTDHSIGDGVTSFEIIEAVRQEVPIELRIAVISGDADAALQNAVTQEGYAFMSKPINPEHLRKFLGAELARV